MNGTLQRNFEETATANRGRYTRGRDRPGCQHPSPRKEEIIAATKSLKNGKPPGKDNISAEVFQRDPQIEIPFERVQVIKKRFCNLCSLTWLIRPFKAFSPV